MATKTVVDCSTGQASTAPLTQADKDEATASAAAQQQQDTQAANRAAMLAKLDAGITAMTAWVANNPNGAQLTNAQTLALAKMVNGLAKLTRGVLNDTAGT